jgi:hypothetical protein
MDSRSDDVRHEIGATKGGDNDGHDAPVFNETSTTNHHHQQEGVGGRNETAQCFVSAAHRRLVNDVQEAMTPANCRKENRSLSTRMKNMYESCRLVAWLAGIANSESTETKCRLKGLIDDRLLSDVEVAVEEIIGAKTVTKVAKATRAAIRQWLDVDDGPAPFAFAAFGYDDYSNYLRSQLRRSDGAPLRGKCYKNKRSNLNNLFKRFKYQPSIEFQEKVDAYLDGVVRIVASAAQSGIGSIVSGKREMSFELYQRVMVWFLQERTHEGIFARAFLALTWNLMCRGVNSCVCLKHLLWKNDSFGLSFSHVKNDQDGSRNFHPRHIYANPDNYLVCCVTAVFEYLLCYPGLFKDEHSMLFPGPCQESRFSDNLSRVLEKHKDELRDLGYNPVDVGVHSIRKGAGTYASSGTTAAPSSVAVNNRGGWTLGGSRDVYLLYERAGDQYVGRILSGMDVLSPKFGASCPEFIHCRVVPPENGTQLLDNDGPVIESASDVENLQNELTCKVSLALESCFGNLEHFVSIRKTLRYGLASVLHHLDAVMLHHGTHVVVGGSHGESGASDNLLDSDSLASPLNLSPVFRNRQIVELKGHVRVIYPLEEEASIGDGSSSISQRCVMRLTGIPPHVVQLAQIKQLQGLVASIRPKILEGVEQMLDDRTINGTLSETRMRTLMESVVATSQNQILAEVRRAGGVLGAGTAGQPLVVEQLPPGTGLYEGMDDGATTVHTLWLHKGKFRRVPPMWAFPKCNVHSAHKLWHTQNTVTGQCAMRFLRPSDVDFQKDGRRRLEEFRFLMWRFDDASRHLGLLKYSMSEMDCNIAMIACIDKLGVSLKTLSGRQRHLERLKWTRYLCLVPNKLRPTQKEHMTTYGRRQPRCVLGTPSV